MPCLLEDIKIHRFEPTSGSDGKGRKWSADEGWYFSCRTCGNSGPVRADKYRAMYDAGAHGKPGVNPWPTVGGKE